MKIIHLSITGRVQGVGYRAFLEREAKARGLKGWVRNRRDGSVEAVVAGEANAIEELVSVCHEGPSASNVGGIERQEGTREQLALRDGGEKFAVLPTV